MSALVVLTACTSPKQTDTAPSSSSATSNEPSASTPSSTTGLHDGQDSVETVPPAPTANPSSTASAVDVADKLMTAFARPDVDATTWINGLYPYLTQAGGQAYVGTDPAQVPVHKVTGTGTVVAGATAYALNVLVPTDAGTYNVSLTRQKPTDPWLADRITPPQG